MRRTLQTSKQYFKNKNFTETVIEGIRNKLQVP